MAVERTVLVVSPTQSLAQTLAFMVRRSGYHPIVVRGFVEAKRYLAAGPHLVITELKLGDYNGLQLAIRASGSSIPAIVIADKSFEGEVEALGSVWMSPDAAKSDELPAVMIELVQCASHDATVAWHDADAGHAALAGWEAPQSSLLH